MKALRGITNGRVRGQAGAVEIAFSDDGRIARVGARLRLGRGAGVLDARGGLVSPVFVDPHLHLDLAYTADLVPRNESGTLIEAIRLWAEFKKQVKPKEVVPRAVRAVQAEVAFGTGAIRTHVDVGTAAGLRLCEGVLEARQRCRAICDIQVAAFPQDGILRDPGAFEQMRRAMAMGCDVVGGIAHNERTDGDSRRHIDKLFELAAEHDADIDCHIDETDDPASRCTEYLAAQTIAAGWQGRVTASHVCALASYDDVHARKVVDLLAEARVHVITNPQVNLHLQGRYDGYPRRRGLTRVRQLLAAGVNVAAGQDCICDPFYPLGTGQMLDVAHTLVHADHLSAPDQIEQAYDCVTTRAAGAMRLADYGIRPGAAANLVILPVADAREAIRQRPVPTHVLKNARLLVRGSD
ncbi:MAG: amidohydrolase family protein [Phycisphaerae bacterium]